MEVKTQLLILRERGLCPSCYYDIIRYDIIWVKRLKSHLVILVEVILPSWVPIWSERVGPRAQLSTQHCFCRESIISQVFSSLLFNRYFCLSLEEELLMTGTSWTDQELCSWGALCPGAMIAVSSTYHLTSALKSHYLEAPEFSRPGPQVWGLGPSCPSTTKSSLWGLDHL